LATPMKNIVLTYYLYEIGISLVGT